MQNVPPPVRVVVGGRYENETVRRAVDGCLTCILGREAALRHAQSLP